MSYIVETLIGYPARWENCWAEDGETLTFASREEADAALAEHIDNCKAAGLTPSNYRITTTQGTAS